MPKYDLEWHKQDLMDEYQEYKDTNGLLNKWSELSDVVYTYTRALWSGHKDIMFPFSRTFFYFGALYMFPKYTLRWKFFRKLGQIVNSQTQIFEVRNPRKESKLHAIAEKYNVDPILFQREAKKLSRRSFLLR